jgi:superfamily II DNA or RNA helicase
VAPGTDGARAASVHLSVDADWLSRVRASEPVPVSIAIQTGAETIPIGDVRTDTPLAMSRSDNALLYVLEDIAEGPVPSHLEVIPRDFINILKLLREDHLACHDGQVLEVHGTPLVTNLRMVFNAENGALIVNVHTECPFVQPGTEPVYIVAGREGWAMAGGHAWPLENLLPEPYHSIYQQPVIVNRPDVVRFMRHELSVLQRFASLESDITLDLFTIDPAPPSFVLRIAGSPASLSATLIADYGVVQLIAAKPDVNEHFAVPDEDDLMRYTVRDRAAERAALERLAPVGFRGETGDSLTAVVGERDVLNVLGTHVPALRRQGWKIAMEGRVAPFFESLDFVMPVVHVSSEEDAPWFDVSFEFECGEQASLSHADVQRAIRHGDAFVQQSGKPILIDTAAVASMMEIFADCASDDAGRSGAFRLSNIYAPFVKSSLDGLDGVDIEDTAAWRKQASQMNRALEISDTPLPPALAAILRPYQKDGVNWLRFLEAQHFGGILADEMGLGKTLQALVWLQLERTHANVRGKPSLIVCPTTLVLNWAEEAARFTPDLKVTVLSGADRHRLWDTLLESDLVITSYALIRRDLKQLLNVEFAALVLDEAQHIKNRSTRNARAAKELRAHHKIVLTGTPVENSVADLWSIMDFLMPGYLGQHKAFRASYEIPIARGGPEADEAQRKLRRKLHPFLMRRLKRNVAKDLPPKIERTTYCVLTADQQVVYRGLVDQARRRLSDMVATQGFNKSRMEVLTTLLRLRQACCHLDLLKLPDLKAKDPSAKMSLFFELVDEALDGGHRILVFSQFVSMLQILQQEFNARDIATCYLDGRTKERMVEVHRFNTQREIPVFLISLKAGGTGLNLTGADMVIHYDPWWNPAVENQATDRAYRIGQKRTVYSNKLITRGTVEEKVLQMQQRKMAVIDATVESDEQMIRSLNWDDVQELLAL